MNKHNFTHFFRNILTKGRVFLLSFLIVLIGFSSSSSAQTKSVYFVGNSVSDCINYIGLKSLASSAGKTMNWGRHMIPGAPLEWIWDHPTDGFEEAPYGLYPDALPNYTWDFISLQPFDRELSQDLIDVTNFVNLAKTKSPNVQILIYQRWPRTPGTTLPADASNTADNWKALYDLPISAYNVEMRAYFETLTLNCRAANLGVPAPLMVPVGQVMYSLNDQMKAGTIPGFNSAWDLYYDGIHINGYGEYVTACTYYATMFKADPRGLGVPSEFISVRSPSFSSAFKTAVQNTVWNIVTNYKDPSNAPWSGVVSADVMVTSIALTPASITKANNTTTQLTATISPANATNKGVVWTSSNVLVATVNTTGLVSAVGAGTATITATSADGGFSKTCALTVTAPGGVDTQAPTAPTNLTADATDVSITLSWTGATDNFGVIGYDVYNGATKVNTSNITTTSYVVTGLTGCTTYPTFTVKAKDAAGLTATSTALSVKTNCAPTAVLNATPNTGAAPLSVSFSTTGSTDPDAGDFILGFDWDFGDGSPHANSNSPTHVYNTSGTYTATLRVMDNRNLYSAMVSKTITVTPGVIAVTLATWNFAGWNPTKVAKTTAPVSTSAANVTVSNLVKGAGIDAGATYFSDNAFDGTGITAQTLIQAIANNEYYEFTITPALGKSVTITSIDVSTLAQNASTFSLLSSQNGFTAANQIASITTSTEMTSNIPLKTFTVTGHNNITSALTFRVYIYTVGDQSYSAYGFGNHNADAGADFIVKGMVNSIGTAVQDITAANLLVYPNPALDMLTLNFGAQMDEGSVMIMDLQGRSLMSRSIANTQVETFDISSLSPGVYFVKANAGNKVMNAKFVKK